MKLSENQIKQIAKTISSQLDPNATHEQIREIIIRIIENLPEEIEKEHSDYKLNGAKELPSFKIPRKLILSAIGPEKNRLVDSLLTFINARTLKLSAISNVEIEGLRSIVIIMDYTDYSSDINRLKFELDQICTESGFKALIQDMSYYGV